MALKQLIICLLLMLLILFLVFYGCRRGVDIEASETTGTEVVTKVEKSDPLANVPAASKKLLPILLKIIIENWKNMKMYSLFAGQIEQETCITLTHKKCWNPNAELKTSREYGFGLGQITISYDSEGKERFNNFIEIKKIDTKLKKWEWKDRFNPNYQLLALVSYDKYLYNLIKWKCATEEDHYAFMLCSYNGGLGGLIKDRQKCTKQAGCDDSKWFNNVEKTSYKATTAVAGYGKSFFEINREYVSNILKKRRFKYIPFLGS